MSLCVLRAVSAQISATAAGRDREEIVWAFMQAPADVRLGTLKVEIRPSRAMQRAATGQTKASEQAFQREARE